MLAFAALSFLSYRSKLKVNKTLLAKNEIISLQKEKLTDSISYASRIQKAVLPGKEVLQMLLPGYFVLFKPCNVVSGDFYWAKEVHKKVFFAVADSTGHGVPGAFMSLLGITFLNEISSMNQFDDPGLVLNLLREKIKKALHQKTGNFEVKDGIDIALCVYNPQNKTLKFAGANRPIFILKARRNLDGFINPERMKIYNVDEKLMVKINPDYQPISFAYHETNFRTNEFQMEDGDLIYLFSDGYVSQLGGKYNKRYMTKNLINLLLQIHDKSLAEQKDILEKRFMEWKGQSEQTDDLLMLGIKF